MAHPDGQLAVQPSEEHVRVAYRQQRGAVFPRAAGVDLAAEMMGDELHAVADAEDRNARPKRLRVDLRRAGVVYARRAAAQDQAGRVSPLELGPGRGAGHELAVDVGLAHAPGDELAELGAEVEDEDCLQAGADRPGVPPATP